ncbi:hypothetical protein BCY91_14125 [Pelobium manganitolerans]|uniref:ATP-dependent Clp protease proteolytic subunit n=1 Tax=Pelobium manganitolerans TaxID=1842495 RepID=A0A419S9W3_9SPHI|nr:head maturation protease, ClpP-related [Pelobium manganitolerans]RKD19010.1 hypothetical protein BCY91_14125 [Pelobium manganitolerans]
MAKQIHIYIYGEIFNYQGKDADDYGMCSLRRVAEVINNNPEAEEVIVHIHSRGGDVTEGFAIYDTLVNSGKTIITQIEGLCASIATVIALAGSVRKINANSEFMIHNAWADPFQMDSFNADDYEHMAEVIRESDERMLNLYAKATGGDREVISEKMEEETYLTAEEALELGFVTEIVEPLKAVAYLSKSNKNQKLKIKMAKKTVRPEPRNTSPLKSILAKIKAVFAEEESGEVTVQSTMLDNGAVIYHDGDLAVGTAVFVDEALTEAVEDGDYVTEAGNTITVADGSVAEIVDASEEETTEELQARVQALEEENRALKAENTTAVNALKDFSTRLAKIKGTHTPKAHGKEKFAKKASQSSKFIRPVKKGGNE